MYIKGNFIEPHTDEWLMARLGHFTSSEWHKLFQGGRKKDDYFGTGAITYINEKVAEILTGVPKEMIKGLPAIDWGVANEPDAAFAYEKTTNQICSHSGFYEYNKVFGGTPDREILHNGKIIIEIKCPHVTSNFIAACKINSGIELLAFDKEKYSQCQGNMLVTESEMCDLVYFDPRIKDPDYQIKIIRIYRDEPFINEGLERLDAATDILIESVETIINMQERNSQFRIAS